MKAGLVSAQSVPLVWPEVSMLVEEYGKEWLEVVELTEVFQRLMADDLDLWVAYRGTELNFVVICAWERHAKISYYHILWLGGKDLRPALKEGLEKLEQYACIQGATEIRFGGRQGWERLLKPFGYGISPRVELRKNVTICWRH